MYGCGHIQGLVTSCFSLAALSRLSLSVSLSPKRQRIPGVWGSGFGVGVWGLGHLEEHDRAAVVATRIPGKPHPCLRLEA